MSEDKTLREAAQAVVDRWDTPLWKDVPATGEYINRLRTALTRAAPAAGAPDLQALHSECLRAMQDGCSRITALDGSVPAVWQYASGPVAMALWKAAGLPGLPSDAGSLPQAAPVREASEAMINAASEAMTNYIDANGYDEATNEKRLARVMLAAALAVQAPAEPAQPAVWCVGSWRFRSREDAERYVETSIPKRDRRPNTIEVFYSAPAQPAGITDTQRVDWLTRQGSFETDTVPSIPHDYELRLEDNRVFKGENLRECIDAAMSGTSEGGVA